MKDNKMKTKLRYDIALIFQMIDFHKQMSIPFTLKLGNSSAVLKTESEEYVFKSNYKSKKFFIAYNKIISDLKNKSLKPINDDLIKYYSVGNISECQSDTIYMIDISCCYPTLLFNEKLITANTLSYLKNIPKQERLAATGMLARKFDIFRFEDEDHYAHETLHSKFQDFFFFCVEKTCEIMKMISSMIGEDYLFTWVDAIYFKNKSNINIVKNVLNYFGLNCSLYILSEFSMKENKNCFKLRFIKDGDKIEMFVPTKYDSIRGDVVKFLLSEHK